MFKIEKEGAFSNTSIKEVSKYFHEIDFDPPYQRYGYVWSRDKRQLLLDSILNGFDLPKFYFHYITDYNNSLNSSGKTYAIIDGKQRLQAIMDFMSNNLQLDKDFVYEKNTSLNLAGKSYNDLAAYYPEVKLEFDSYKLDIVSIITDEIEKIEELFYRLNEGKPLNNAEKRNRFVGFINNEIKRIISTNHFFTKKFQYRNTRLQYDDLCLKLIYTEYKGGLFSSTKEALDEFVENHRNTNDKLSDAISNVEVNLDKMNNIFIDDDPLLKSRSLIPVYYYFISRVVESTQGVRHYLLRFNEIREISRKQKDSNPLLSEFDRQNQQGTHRDKSLIYRETLLEKYYMKYIQGSLEWDTKVPTDDLEIKIQIEQE